MGKMAKVLEVVDFQHEARSAINAALDDVLRDSGKIESRWPGHGEKHAWQEGRLLSEKPQT
jgi:hypothetical protein